MTDGHSGAQDSSNTADADDTVVYCSSGNAAATERMDGMDIHTTGDDGE